MNKKKLVVLLLVVIMVLTLALTALVGCKPKTEDEQLELSTALQEVVNNSVKDHLLNNLAASAEISVKTNYGGTEKQLKVAIAGNIALDTKDNNETSFSLSVTDAKANANILHVAYFEDVAGKTGDLYLVLGAGESQQKFVINAISIKDVLKKFFKAEIDPDTDKVMKDDDGNIIYQKDDDGNPIDCGVTE